MTESTPATSTPTRPAWTRWLYPAAAITGIAVGIFIIVAGLYLVFAQPNCGGAMKDGMPCCAEMKQNMKHKMDDMKNMPGMPSPSQMPSMPTPPMPTPGR